MDKNRILHNDHRICMIDIDDSVVVEKGDFIFTILAGDVSDDASNLTLEYGCPASYLLDGGDAAANRVVLAAQLIGVALEPSPDGVEGKIAVGYNGSFVLDQKTGATIQLGDKIEIYSADPNHADDEQTIIEGSTSIVGTCIKTKTTTTAVTEVEVLLQPALMNRI